MAWERHDPFSFHLRSAYVDLRVLFFIRKTPHVKDKLKGSIFHLAILIFDVCFYI